MTRLLNAFARQKIVASVLGLSMATAPAAAQQCNPTIDPDRSIVLHDPATLKEPFALKGVIAQLLRDLPVPATGPDAEAALIASLVATFAKSEEVNPIANLMMDVDARPGENKLVASRLLDPNDVFGLVPVGVFNRFDLASANFSHCGEYRIVYSFKAAISNPQVGSIPDRFFLIFETKIPNPQQMGAAGCLGLADYWRDLSDIGDDAQRVEAVRKFFFDGIPGYPPAIKADHLSALGQLRGNLFVEDKWQLREWKLLPTAPAQFVMATVKSNPLAELYADDGKEVAEVDALRALFHSQFASANGILAELLEPELGFLPNAMKNDPRLNPKDKAFDQLLYEKTIVNRVGSRLTDDRFNEFQSDSQGNLDIPAGNLGPKFETEITTALTNLRAGFPDGADVTVDQVIARAGAISCGGCHQHTNNKPIGSVNGTTFNWPTTQNNNGFVHVTEVGKLSQTLTDRMIPFRRDTLAEFICEPPINQIVALAEQQDRFEAAMTEYNQTVTDYQLARMGAIVARQLNTPTQSGRQLTDVDLVRIESEVSARFEKSLRQSIEAVTEAERRLPGAFVQNRRPH
ncbi:hypothetical protein B5P46_01915 [Rhizobium leguminosarum]|uniref:Cytochrome c domain-containing protein n=1 Tax=Rhizobium leguminosarum TaxID=384 RepID=A0A4Q1UFL0_RHILE|nr:hypothetical protein [Rhizobium leguminosarum]RXT29845.1 hypothetical protein B5P46_01915 [Rhizobium leguminosarum]